MRAFDGGTVNRPVDGLLDGDHQPACQFYLDGYLALLKGQPLAIIFVLQGICGLISSTYTSVRSGWSTVNAQPRLRLKPWTMTGVAGKSAPVISQPARCVHALHTRLPARPGLVRVDIQVGRAICRRLGPIARTFEPNSLSNRLPMALEAKDT